ncbi:radical SAM/SPASM domain-containing protein [Thiolapillus sp.]
MSSFAEKMHQTWEQNLLFSVLLELTYSCNLDCTFCYNEKALQGKAISRKQYLEIFQDLRDMGVFNLILSGGEPLAHKDFFLFGAKAREMGFVIRIKSNGHALHSVTAKRLKEEVDPFSIEISLHGACARTHDRQTRVRGSFEQLMKNMRTLKALGLRFQFNSVLTSWNEDEVGDMYALAEKFAVPVKFDSQVTPKDNGDRSPLEITPSEQGLRRLFEYQQGFAGTASGSVAKPTATTRTYCGAGTSTIAIDPVGNVYPCVQWRQAIGNVHDQNIQQIWQNNATLTGIRKVNEQAQKNMLAQGEKAAFGSFCPGMADLVSGDATTIYPSVHLRSKLHRDMLNSTEN